MRRYEVTGLMPRAVIVLNPRSRAGGRPPIGRVLRAFVSAGWDAELWASEGEEWAEQAARRAVEQGVTAVFGAGGDGLLAHMLPALLHSDVALGVVPLGTGNIWARELGLPLDPARAVAVQLAAPARRVDLGLANGRPFLMIASAGFDAHVVRQAEAGLKGLGQMGYPLAGMTLAGAVRGVVCRVAFDDEPTIEMELLAAIAMNGRLYGGLVSLVPDARIDDGWLDLVLLSGSGPFDAAVHAARIISGLHLTDPNVTIRRARRMRVEPVAGALPVQADGDPRGTTPLDVEIVPGALPALGVATEG